MTIKIGNDFGAGAGGEYSHQQHRDKQHDQPVLSETSKTQLSQNRLAAQVVQNAWKCIKR